MTREEIKDKLFEFMPSEQSIQNYSFEQAIDEVVDYFESRMCENCEHSGKLNTSRIFECFKGIGQHHEQHMYDECEMYSDKNFYCSEWEAKDAI